MFFGAVRISQPKVRGSYYTRMRVIHIIYLLFVRNRSNLKVKENRFHFLKLLEKTFFFFVMDVTKNIEAVGKYRTELSSFCEIKNTPLLL